jgi:hypothetical protein
MNAEGEVRLKVMEYLHANLETVKDDDGMFSILCDLANNPSGIRICECDIYHLLCDFLDVVPSDR